MELKQKNAWKYKNQEYRQEKNTIIYLSVIMSNKLQPLKLNIIYVTNYLTKTKTVNSMIWPFT